MCVCVCVWIKHAWMVCSNNPCVCARVRAYTRQRAMKICRRRRYRSQMRLLLEPVSSHVAYRIVRGVRIIEIFDELLRVPNVALRSVFARQRRGQVTRPHVHLQEALLHMGLNRLDLLPLRYLRDWRILECVQRGACRWPQEHFLYRTLIQKYTAEELFVCGRSQIEDTLTKKLIPTASGCVASHEKPKEIHLPCPPMLPHPTPQ